jgi:hypothetical protein
MRFYKGLGLFKKYGVKFRFFYLDEGPRNRVNNKFMTNPNMQPSI